MPERMKNSLIWTIPSPLLSETASMPTLDQFCTQVSACTSSTAFPITAVGSEGSSSCSFVSVARAGAVKYSRKMNSSDQPTERRAERTDGVVK